MYEEALRRESAEKERLKQGNQDLQQVILSSLYSLHVCGTALLSAIVSMSMLLYS